MCVCVCVSNNFYCVILIAGAAVYGYHCPNIIRRLGYGKVEGIEAQAERMLLESTGGV